MNRFKFRNRPSGLIIIIVIYNITRILLKRYPDASSKDLVKIIYEKYPIESELLLDYAIKYKHIMK